MTILRVPVDPIARGYAFAGGLTFTAPNDQLPFDLEAARRVRGEFRDHPNGPLLAVVDTALHTLEARGPGELVFDLTAEQTTTFGGPAVVVDFAYFAGGVWAVVPATIRWPVRQPITRRPK